MAPTVQMLLTRGASLLALDADGESMIRHQVAPRASGVRSRWSLYKDTSDAGLTASYTTVFQLGLFLRALRPARTGLRPVRFTRALPEFIIKKKKINLILFLN